MSANLSWGHKACSLGTMGKQSSLKQLCKDLGITPELETGKDLSSLLMGSTNRAAQGLGSSIP